MLLETHIGHRGVCSATVGDTHWTERDVCCKGHTLDIEGCVLLATHTGHRGVCAATVVDTHWT